MAFIRCSSVLFKYWSNVFRLIVHWIKVYFVSTNVASSSFGDGQWPLLSRADSHVLHTKLPMHTSPNVLLPSPTVVSLALCNRTFFLHCRPVYLILVDTFTFDQFADRSTGVKQSSKSSGLVHFWSHVPQLDKCDHRCDWAMRFVISSFAPTHRSYY